MWRDTGSGRIVSYPPNDCTASLKRDAGYDVADEGVPSLPINIQQDRIVLSGDCPIEEAEILLNLPDLPVDLSQAGHLHAAVFQALLARGARAIGPAGDQFVERWLRPLLRDTANV